MIKLISTYSFLIFLSFSLNAQDINQEIGFLYVKAEYLLETERFDEAVAAYNQVIEKDPKYKEALIHRAIAKYALGAYKGTKNDALKSIEIKGIESKSAAWLGRSFIALNEIDEGINSLSAAIAIDRQNSNYLFWRANAFENAGMKLKACQDFEAAGKLGNIEASNRAQYFCGVKQMPHEKITKEDNIEINTKTQDDVAGEAVVNEEPLTMGERISEDTNIGFDSSTPSQMDDNDIVNDENTPKNDFTVNRLVIDDDLVISITGQELGVRTIKEIPSILILSDEDAKIAIDICVNIKGEVTKAEFNGNLSSTAKKSMVSLAIRKAKEFEFNSGVYDLQCGVMTFDIKKS